MLASIPLLTLFFNKTQVPIRLSSFIHSTHRERALPQPHQPRFSPCLSASTNQTFLARIPFSEVPPDWMDPEPRQETHLDPPASLLLPLQRSWPKKSTGQQVGCLLLCSLPQPLLRYPPNTNTNTCLGTAVCLPLYIGTNLISIPIPPTSPLHPTNQCVDNTNTIVVAVEAPIPISPPAAAAAAAATDPEPRVTTYIGRYLT